MLSFFFPPPKALLSGCYHDRQVFSRVRVTRVVGRKAGIERAECYLVKVMNERNPRRAIKRKLTFFIKYIRHIAGKTLLRIVKGENLSSS